MSNFNYGQCVKTAVGTFLAGAIALGAIAYSYDKKDSGIEQRVQISRPARDESVKLEPVIKLEEVKLTEAATLEEAVNSGVGDLSSENLVEETPKTRPSLVFNDPKYTRDDNFASDREDLVLARLIYGEARSEIKNADYCFGVAMTVKNRVNSSGKSFKDVALENHVITKRKNKKIRNVKVWQYSCFMPSDPSYEPLKDPIKFSGNKTWEACYNLAEETINGIVPKNKIQEKLERATHYYVNCVKKPFWADDGKLIAEIPVLNGKYTAYFYDLSKSNSRGGRK